METQLQHKFIRKYIKNGSIYNGSIYLEYTDGIYVQKTRNQNGILSTWLEKGA